MRRATGVGAVMFAVMALATAVAWVRSHYRANAVTWVDFRPHPAAVDPLDPLDPKNDFIDREQWFRMISVDGQLRLEWESISESSLSSFHEAGVTAEGGWVTMAPRDAHDRWAGLDDPGSSWRWSELGFAMMGRHDRWNGLNAVQGWHSTIPDSALVILSGAVACRLGLRYRRIAQAARRGLCRRCGYDLRGTPARCPECGTPIGAVDVIGRVSEDRG